MLKPALFLQITSDLTEFASSMKYTISDFQTSRTGQNSGKRRTPKTVGKVGLLGGLDLEYLAT